MKIVELDSFRELKKNKLYVSLLEYLSEEHQEEGFILPDDILLPIYDLLREREQKNSEQLMDAVLEHFVAGYNFQCISETLDITEAHALTLVSDFVQANYEKKEDRTFKPSVISDIYTYLSEGKFGHTDKPNVYHLSHKHGISVDDVNYIIDEYEKSI